MFLPWGRFWARHPPPWAHRLGNLARMLSPAPLLKSWLFPRALGRHSILGHCTWSAVGRKLTLCPSASRPAAQNLPVGLLRQRHCFDQDSFLQHGVIISIYYLCFCPLTSSFSPKSS